ncbi:PH domain-containing protein [Levilactobacillus yonginensis]|uniref:PH domain-containing protein n=1 Tax=Levilactobacillus yonginensis TaxID=1054041 RepID=UPI000F78A810|nr:PH domain-containing protein [Levilactobacillus yonginensis]
MTTPRRTNILGLIQHIATSIKDYWYLFVILLAQNGVPRIILWGGFFLMLFVFLIWPILKWVTLTYAVTPDALIIHSGIFVRHHEHIPYVRIQTVQRKQWFYLQPFHLEEVQIETASHEEGKPEARLAAVPLTVAQEINRLRQAAPVGDTPTAAVVEDGPVNAPAAHYQITLADLIKFSLTSLIFLPFLLVLLGLYDKLPHSWTNLLVNEASHLAILFLIGSLIVIVLLTWLVAFVGTLLHYYRFTLTRDDDQLHTAKGLLQRNTISAPLDRIQALRFKQNPLRRGLHLQTVQVLLASKAAAKDDDNDLTILPVINERVARDTIHPFVDWLPTQAPSLTELQVSRTWYQIRNAVLIILIPALLIGWLWPTISWWLLPVWLIIAVATGRFAARHTGGSRLQPDLLVLQTGHFFTLDCTYVPLRNIQSVRLSQSIWMKRTQLAHLTINVRRGNGNQAIRLRYLPQQNAQAIYDWYRTHS